MPPAQHQQQEDTDALQLYLLGVEAGQLHEVAQRLEVSSQVAPTQRLQGADAVLAARAKVSQVRGSYPVQMPGHQPPGPVCFQILALAQTVTAQLAYVSGDLAASSCCIRWLHLSTRMSRQ